MLKNNFNRIGVGACYNNIGYLTFYMDSFELSKDMFTEAIKNSNQITAIGRSFNRSIAYYFLAENTSVEPEVKFEEAADSFEDWSIRLNSLNFSSTNEEDINFRELNFLCRYFKLCWNLKKDPYRYSKRYSEELEQLKSQIEDNQGKRIVTIKNQLIGFLSFLHLRSYALSKIYKGKEKPFIGSLAGEIVTYLDQWFVKSECINSFIFNTLIKTFIDFLTEVTQYIVENTNSINQEMKEVLLWSIL